MSCKVLIQKLCVSGLAVLPVLHLYLYNKDKNYADVAFVRLDYYEQLAFTKGYPTGRGGLLDPFLGIGVPLMV